MPWTLIVDDEPNLCRVLLGLLEQAGYAGRSEPNAERALPWLQDPELALVLTDLRMPGRDGLELVSLVHARRPELPVVMMTAYGTIATAVEAMKRGAHDFLVKPVDREELLFCVRKALGRARTDKGIYPFFADAEGRYRLIGRAPAMQRIYEVVEKLAHATTTVLVAGESGTGKELVARAIHSLGPRRDQPLVKVNCAALPEALLESELFGYEPGAFTGATRTKPGRFELAQGGTLFLDEIAELSPGTQAKLLRVLQDREFERLGGVTTLTADVRTIVATNQDLRRAVDAGRFRSDLYFRIHVVRIDLPPLRERVSDIPELAAFFLERFGRQNGKAELAFDPATLAALCAHAWPGNVRELENAIERAVVLANGPLLLPADLPPEVRTVASPAPPAASAEAARAGAAATDLKQAVAGTAAGVERALIERALAEAGGNRSHAARALGISRRTLQKRLKEYGSNAAEPPPK